jgi:twitching motility two-component system response regulator PilH
VWSIFRGKIRAATQIIKYPGRQKKTGVDMDQITNKNFLARMLKQKEQAPSAAPAAHAGTVMVVDDSRTIVHALQMLLVRAGYSTVPAYDGVQAVELAKRHMPDIILMDIVMPNMNGFETTRTLKADARTRPIPIIIISGTDQIADRMWGTRLGARAFLSKPINKTELLAKIESLLSQGKRTAPAPGISTTTTPAR